MKVFPLESRSAPVVERDEPDLKPTGNEVLLRVSHAGVCHTDIHVQDGGYDLGSRGMLDMMARGFSYPAVMGHETVGEVVAVGEAVDDVEVGETRLVFPWIGCGQCVHCRHGQENYCGSSQALGIFRPGGFAEHIMVPHSRYAVDVAGVDPAWAAVLACSGVTAYASARKALAYANPDDPVAVIGTGGVGMMAIAVLKALGHRNTVAVDVNDDSLAVARELGASNAVNTSVGGPEALVERSGGPVAAVIDFVNSGDTVSLAFDALAKAGTLIHVGLYGGEFVLPTALMALKALTLQGNYAGNLDDVHAVVDLAKRGVLPRLPITQASLTTEDINSTLDSLRAGTVRGRMVLVAPEAR